MHLHSAPVLPLPEARQAEGRARRGAGRRVLAHRPSRPVLGKFHRPQPQLRHRAARPDRQPRARRADAPGKRLAGHGHQLPGRHAGKRKKSETGRARLSGRHHHRGLDRADPQAHGGRGRRAAAEPPQAPRGKPVPPDAARRAGAVSALRAGLLRAGEAEPGAAGPVCGPAGPRMGPLLLFHENPRPRQLRAGDAGLSALQRRHHAAVRRGGQDHLHPAAGRRHRHGAVLLFNLVPRQPRPRDALARRRGRAGDAAVRRQPAAGERAQRRPQLDHAGAVQPAALRAD